jgi:hypothetical protein
VGAARSAAERRAKGLSARSEARVRAKARTSAATPEEGEAGPAVGLAAAVVEEVGADEEKGTVAVESRRSK